MSRVTQEKISFIIIPRLSGKFIYEVLVYQHHLLAAVFLLSPCNSFPLSDFSERAVCYMAVILNVC